MTFAFRFRKDTGGGGRRKKEFTSQKKNRFQTALFHLFSIFGNPLVQQ